MSAGHGLVLPDDTSALRRAYARYLTLACQRFLGAAAELPARFRRAHAELAGLIGAALQRGERHVLRCFAAPTVGTPLQCLALRGELADFAPRIEQAVAEMLPHLALELALRGMIPTGTSVLWDCGAPTLASSAVGGLIIAPEGATALRFSASHLAAIDDAAELGRLPLEPQALRQALRDGTGGFRFERRFWRTGDTAQFATVDHNPIAAFELHPEKTGNHVDLGGRSAAEWVRMLDQCFALVEQFMPGELAEMRTMLQVIIPVGYDEVRHLSASYREAVGTVYLTLHPNVMTMTEAIIHEFQHNKFNVSAYTSEYLSNAFHPLYKSPIRPDPRPLWGILLAVHAFLPVADLYRRMRDGGHPWAARPDFERRMAEIDLKNHEGMEMLRAHGEWTADGRAMLADLEALEHRHMAERTARGLETTPTEIHLA